MSSHQWSSMYIRHLDRLTYLLIYVHLYLPRQISDASTLENFREHHNLTEDEKIPVSLLRTFSNRTYWPGVLTLSMRNSCVDINLFIFHVHVIIFTNSLKSIVSDLSVSICKIYNFIVGFYRLVILNIYEYLTCTSAIISSNSSSEKSSSISFSMS